MLCNVVGSKPAHSSGCIAPLCAPLTRSKQRKSAACKPCIELNLLSLQDLAAAGKASRTERRWDAILGPGTWPEILRRYALVRAGEDLFQLS